MYLSLRLESKGCTFKASGRVLKVIRRSLVLMKRIRSKRNLYELQVDCGSLGHKSVDGNVLMEMCLGQRE